MLSATLRSPLNGDVFRVAGITTANSQSSIGVYPVSYTVTGSNLQNYTVAAASGTLTITHLQLHCCA